MRACTVEQSGCSEHLIRRASALACSPNETTRATPASRACAAQAVELRIVAVDDGGPAGLEPVEDLGLGVGDRLDRAEEFEMHRLDRGDDRHMRARQGGERPRSRRRGSCRSRAPRSAPSAGSGRATAARPNDCCRRRPRHGSRPSAASARRSASLVLVLPTEPVTPMTFASRARARRPRQVARARRARRARPGAAPARASPRACRRRRRARRRRRPRARRPRSRGRRGSRRRWRRTPRPGTMLRLSIEIPRTAAGSAPARSARIACAIASTVQSGSTLMPLPLPRAQRRPPRGR